MSPNALDSLNADISDMDGIPSCEGPVFYSLPQSVQDELTAHFLAAMSEQGPAQFGSEMLLAA